MLPALALPLEDLRIVFYEDFVLNFTLSKPPKLERQAMSWRQSRFTVFLLA